MTTSTLLAVVGVCACAAQADIFVVDFEFEDDGVTPLVNGQHIEVDGGNTEFGTLFRLNIPSDPDHLGGVIFDTSIGGPNDGGPDPDLIVGLGNALTLQDTDDPTQTVPGIFDTPNDFFGTGRYEFTMLQAGLGLTELTIIDGNGGFGAIIELVDGAGLTRTYTVPSNYTFDIDSEGPDGFDTLDLTILDPQQGEGGGIATAVEDDGFNPLDLASFSIDHTGSGAFDNFRFVPAPGTLTLLGLAGVLSVRRRR